MSAIMPCATSLPGTAARSTTGGEPVDAIDPRRPVGRNDPALDQVFEMRQRRKPGGGD
jgi:hypothetical protein